MLKKTIWLNASVLAVRSWRLRILAVVGCLGVSVSALEAQTMGVTATWNANSESDIAGYVLSYGTQTGIYSTAVDVANATMWQGSLPSGVRYYFVVDAYNTSHETSPNSAEVFFDVGAAPTVSVTAPADQSTVFGMVSITATATDPVGVTGLQFQIDGASQGPQEMMPPFSLAWNSNAVVNGTHTIAAVATDAAGHTGASAVSVTVANTSTVPNVVNMTQTNATNALVRAGLAAGVVTMSVNATVPAGSVISENPVAGTTVALGSSVALSVSSGSGSAAVITIWSASATPAAIETTDNSAVELGVKFRSDVKGNVTGVRFYKGATNTGAHTGSLWSATGTRLASATFSGESVSGWQTVTFSRPVSITANTTYVVSYHTNVGNYAKDESYFASSGVDSLPLHALANGVKGGDGVYRYGAGFPKSTWNSTNYWVDVMFATQ